jgi:hypothetical protein
MGIELASCSEIDLYRQVLAKSGRLRFRALGGSMFPGVRSGDILTVEPASGDELHPGDLLFFSHDGGLLAHRLLRKELTADGLELTTRGDFVPSAEAPVPLSHVLGKVVSIHRGGRTIRLDSAFRRQQGRLLAWLLHPMVLLLKPANGRPLSPVQLGGKPEGFPASVITPEQVIRSGQERYLPLVDYILHKSANPWVLSAELEAKIAALRRQITVRNIILSEEWKGVQLGLAEAGVEAVLLKGAMMEALYPAGLRPFTDIDFLVPQRELARVREVLESRGYRTRFDLALDQDLAGETECVREGSIPVMLEPHWLLVPSFLASERFTEDARRRAQATTLNGDPSLVLSPEDALLHSCLHFFLHYRQNGGLNSACDIAELIYAYGSSFDWPEFLKRVSRYLTGLAILLALRKTVELLQAPIPGFVLAELALYRPALTEKLIYLSLVKPERPNQAAGVFLAHLISRSGSRARAKFLWGKLFPSGKFMEDRYRGAGHGPLFFYYLIRLKDSAHFFLTAGFRFVSVIGSWLFGRHSRAV